MFPGVFVGSVGLCTLPVFLIVFLNCIEVVLCSLIVSEGNVVLCSPSVFIKNVVFYSLIVLEGNGVLSCVP